MNKFIDLIGHDLSIPGDRIAPLIKSGKHRHRVFTIKKRSGGDRIITQPIAELKMIQYWLIENVFSKLEISKIATAFHKKASILSNAKQHANLKYSIRIDLQDFFHSIKTKDLEKILVKSGLPILEAISIEDFMYVIDNVCFDRDSALPIGYPSSPIISNIVMYDFDETLKSEIISSADLIGENSLTRYADDFVFSTNKRGACHTFFGILTKVVNKTASPKLKINVEKTRFMSRGGGSTIITGLRIDNDGNIRIHSTQKSHIRLLLKLYCENRLNPEDIPRLIGHLAYIEGVDPEFFTVLSRKFFLEISKIRAGLKN